MGFSRVTNRWLNRTYKIIAILLVVFAALISSLRLFLPYAHNYRADLQDYLNQQFNSQVVIGELNMGWQGSGPSLVAGNVTLLESEAAVISINAIDFHIDFWRSLQMRKVVTRDLTLDGVTIFLDQTLLQQSDNSTQDLSLLDNIADLFLEQISRFTLKNTEITYRKADQERVFLVNEMNWKNEGLSHYAQGSVIVDGLSSNNLQMSMRLRGEDIADMQGTVYFQANELNITPWLDRVLAIENEQTHSSINFDAWLTLDKGAVSQVQVALGENHIEWQMPNGSQSLSLEQGQVWAQNIDSTGVARLYTSVLKLSLNDTPWQTFSLQAYRSNSEQFIFADQIKLDRIEKILPLFHEAPELQGPLNVMAIEGKLLNTFVLLKDNQLQVVSRGEGVSIDENNDIPGISNIDLDVVFSDKQLALSISGEQGQLDLGSQFLAPLPFDQFNANVYADLRNNDKVINVEQLVFNSSDISLSGDLTVSVPENDKPSLSLIALAENVESFNAKKFFPNQLMGEDLVNYLNGALQKGRIEQANVIFNGALDEFPFGHGEGTFVVDAELIDGEFKFDSEWPEITSFAANLNFTNNEMLITGRAGRLSGLAVEGVTAKIPQLSHEQELLIDAILTPTSPEYIKNLMDASPLADSVGEALTALAVEGKVQGDFQLRLPLDDVEQAVATGNVVFNDNRINLQSPQMLMTKVNGVLSFNNEQLSTKDLHLNWRDMPIAISVSAEQKSRYYQTLVKMQAQWAESLWHQQLPTKLKRYAEGEVTWQGDLALNFYQGNEFSYSFDLLSDLRPTKINLPAPFEKAQDDTMALSVSVAGREDKSTITAVLGEQLNFYGVLDHEQITFKQSHLVLGDEQMLMPMSGFYITTHLEQAQFEPWYAFVDDLLTSVETVDNNPSAVPLFPAPERISGNVGKLDVLGQVFTDVSYSVVDEQAWQLLQVNAKEARAAIKFFPDWLTQGVAVDADFIHIPPDETEIASTASKVSTVPDVIAPSEESPKLSDEQLFAQLPPMQVKCRSCKLGLLDLGEVNFAVERASNEQIKLNHFVAKRGKTKLTVDGVWRYNEQQSLTSLNGLFSSGNIGREIESLGYASIIKDSGIDMNFDLAWQGGPHRYQLASLNGNVSSALNAGYLADIDDKGLRIFSILSLQSLVRKLTLDFRDIFSDGLFYSEIKGDMKIEQGVLSTDNTRLKGTAGDLTVKGNTDLNKGVLDYYMSYKPNLTSSLPVLAWIATLNPVTFLAGVAIDEVITSKVVSEYNMTLSGDVANPDLKVIDRKSKNVRVSGSNPPQIVENTKEEAQPQGKVTPMKKEDPIEPPSKSEPDGVDG